MSIDDSASPRHYIPGHGNWAPVMMPSGECDWVGVEGGLTKREYAALTLRVPMSGDPELDAMIRAAQRRDVAAAVVQGIAACSHHWPDLADGPEMARRGASIADALLQKLET